MVIINIIKLKSCKNSLHVSRVYIEQNNFTKNKKEIKRKQKLTKIFFRQ